jgi:hypothetical protein
VNLLFKVWSGIRTGLEVVGDMPIEEVAETHRVHTLAVGLMDRRVNRFRKEGDCVELVSRHGRDVLRFIGPETV